MTRANPTPLHAPTPLHRDAALSHESHRHELLDPTTLRWVAELLKELEHLPCAQVAEQLELVAQTAGRAIDVHWRRDVRRDVRVAKRAESGSYPAVVSDGAVATKRSGGSGRTSPVATEATRRASR